MTNLEHVADAGTLGVSWIRGLDVDRRYAQIMGLEHRDGMDTYSLRRGSLGVKDRNWQRNTSPRTVPAGARTPGTGR